MVSNNFNNTPESNSHCERVLVTGANGFVGANLCKKLISDGYHVIAGVREKPYLIYGIIWGAFII